MTLTREQREFWREQFTDAIIMAAGAAVILGRQDIAQELNKTLIEISKEPKKPKQNEKPLD